MVSKCFFKLMKMGDCFIKVKVDVDENFVWRNFGGREICFKVELWICGIQIMVINYGIILKNRRYWCVFFNKYFGILYEELFLKYCQYYYGQCMIGLGLVVWIKIFGYFNNMVVRIYNLSYL